MKGGREVLLCAAEQQGKRDPDPGPVAKSGPDGLSKRIYYSSGQARQLKGGPLVVGNAPMYVCTLGRYIYMQVYVHIYVWVYVRANKPTDRQSSLSPTSCSFPFHLPLSLHPSHPPLSPSLFLFLCVCVHIKYVEKYKARNSSSTTKIKWNKKRNNQTI